EATSPAGAPVFFMPPTALDDPSDTAHVGTTVSCAPAPNTTFPIGTTTVTCTATNALGAASSGQFDVIVHDTLAPNLSNVPSDITQSNNPVVTFTPPTALDQVDGARPVVCKSATGLISGSKFPAGTTAVTCSASDTRGNTAHASFNVTI